MRNGSAILLAAVLAAAAGCGGSGGSYGSGPNTSGGSTSKQITVKNNLFDPSATTVPVGSTVTWTWAQGAVVHNVMFDDGQKSADQSTGTYLGGRLHFHRFGAGIAVRNRKPEDR